MSVDINNSAEYMGLFGFSWEEKVASFVKKQLKGTAAAKKLSDFFQAGGLNVSLVKNLYNEYAALMAKSYQPVSFSVSPGADGSGGTFSPESIELSAIIANKTNVETPIVLSFFQALFVLSRDGKIPFAKWNPAGWKESTQLRKSFSSEQGFLDSATKAATKAVDSSKVFLIIAGIGAAAYLLSQLKNFTHK
jgi:hypothetical protein